MPRQPIRFRAHLGAGRGMVELPGLFVIGLNSEFMGPGHAEEAAQAPCSAEAATAT